MKTVASALVATSLALGIALAIAPAHADTLVIPLGDQTTERYSPMPQRGLGKGAVAQRFGEPSRRHAAIGQPPITRWDYPDYSVYFEYDRVIDSVRHRQARGASAP